LCYSSTKKPESKAESPFRQEIAGSENLFNLRGRVSAASGNERGFRKGLIDGALRVTACGTALYAIVGKLFPERLLNRRCQRSKREMIFMNLIVDASWGYAE
jgi:hypothetical protein